MRGPAHTVSGNGRVGGQRQGSADQAQFLARVRAEENTAGRRRTAVESDGEQGEGVPAAQLLPPALVADPRVGGLDRLDDQPFDQRAGVPVGGLGDVVGGSTGFLSHPPDRSNRVCTWRGWCEDRRRFKTKVLRGPACAWWLGALGEDGYGRFACRSGSTVRVGSAHRWVWEHDLGRLPDGVLLRHSCDETNCVRLDHLIPGEHPANMADMCARGRQGGPWHRGRADIRGLAGRARAIRAALQTGWDPQHLGEVMSAGDPNPRPAHPVPRGPG